MGYSISKVVFPDGFELFTVGDGSVIAMHELHDSREAAWDAYCADRDEPKEVHSVIIQDAEPVTCFATYGDGAWKEMRCQNAKASRSQMRMVVMPHYDEQSGLGWHD